MRYAFINMIETVKTRKSTKLNCNYEMQMFSRQSPMARSIFQMRFMKESVTKKNQ